MNLLLGKRVSFFEIVCSILMSNTISKLINIFKALYNKHGCFGIEEVCNLIFMKVEIV